jgi:hypothetical protein
LLNEVGHIKTIACGWSNKKFMEEITEVNKVVESFDLACNAGIYNIIDKYHLDEQKWIMDQLMKKFPKEDEPTIIPANWMNAICNINIRNIINGCGELIDETGFREIILSNGIIDNCKINSFIELLTNMQMIGVPLDEDQMKIILAKPQSD